MIGCVETSTTRLNKIRRKWPKLAVLRRGVYGFSSAKISTAPGLLIRGARRRARAARPRSIALLIVAGVWLLFAIDGGYVWFRFMSVAG